MLRAGRAHIWNVGDQPNTITPSMTDFSADRVDVSIVLPVYNEAGHLRDEVERITKTMDASDYSYEIIVVDDGSTDRSGEELRAMEGIRLIQFLQNRGSGAARKVGTRQARGDVVVWTDADMTYPNDDIPTLLDQMPGWDQVVGARTSEQGTKRFFRIPAKWFIRKLAEYLTGTKIPDLNSGLRAFRREVADQYLHRLPSGFSCVTTITMAFLANGYSIKYVPISYSPRAGESKFHWWADTRRYLLQVVRMVLSYNPIKVLMPFSVIVLLVGTGKLIYDVVGKDFRIAGNTLLLFSAGFIILLAALIADLVVQVSKPIHEVDPAHVDSGFHRG
jgi:glycosyltransferase involved in cell wall biosynthesis